MPRGRECELVERVHHPAHTAAPAGQIVDEARERIESPRVRRVGERRRARARLVHRHHRRGPKHDRRAHDSARCGGLDRDPVVSGGKAPERLRVRRRVGPTSQLGGSNATRRRERLGVAGAAGRGRHGDVLERVGVEVEVSVPCAGRGPARGADVVLQGAQRRAAGAHGHPGRCGDVDRGRARVARRPRRRVADGHVDRPGAGRRVRCLDQNEVGARSEAPAAAEHRSRRRRAHHGRRGRGAVARDREVGGRRSRRARRRARDHDVAKHASRNGESVRTVREARRVTDQLRCTCTGSFDNPSYTVFQLPKTFNPSGFPLRIDSSRRNNPS